MIKPVNKEKYDIGSHLPATETKREHLFQFAPLIKERETKSRDIQRNLV